MASAGVVAPMTHFRSGVALLVALAATVILSTALAVAWTAAGGAAGETVVDRIVHQQSELLRVGERLAADWIRTRSAEAVLVPEGGGLVILHDGWSVPGQDGRLHLQMHDGLAGVPASLAKRGSPLRLAMPAQLLPIEIPARPAPVAGAVDDLLELIELPAGTRRFPAAIPTVPARFGGKPVVGRALVAASPAADVASAISVHSDGRININTAPKAVLELVYQMLDLGEVETLLARRAAGAFTRAPSKGRARTSEDAKALTLVDHSDLWYALITVEVDGARRAWWVVFAGNPRQPLIVQRHAAD